MHRVALAGPPAPPEAPDADLWAGQSECPSGPLRDTRPRWLPAPFGGRGVSADDQFQGRDLDLGASFAPIFRERGVPKAAVKTKAVGSGSVGRLYPVTSRGQCWNAGKRGSGWMSWR